MAYIQLTQHWMGRFLASDPGRIRLDKAARATVSLMVSLFTTLLIMRATGHTLITPAIVSGMIGMLGIMIVMDNTKKKMKRTTLLLGVAAMIGITIGSSLAGNAYYIDILMVLSIFSSFYFTRYGSRYFSIFMITFMMVYLSSVLTLSSSQLPWFFMGIWIGVGYTYVLNFILFQRTSKNLKQSIRSFHYQSNLTFNLLLQGMQRRDMTKKQRKSLQKNVLRLREYAIIVSGYIRDEDVQEMWPGLKPAQLRLYVFDTGMLIETLTDSMRSLKKAEALEIDEIRRLLIWVTKSLRDAKVLAPQYEEQNLEEAEQAVQMLRMLILELLDKEEQPKGWVFLIRRIESIANHVIEGAITIQQSLHSPNRPDDEPEEEKEEIEQSPPAEKEKKLKPSTKKAYQALIAGILAIIIGQIISPAQPYWVLLTAFLVLLGTESIGRIYTKGFQRSLGTIIGAVIGFALAKLFSGQSFIEVILIFLVVFLAFYLFTVSYTLMSMFITMMLAFMYDILLGGITLSLITARVTDTIAGAAIALGVSTFVFPKKTKAKVAESINEFLTELKPYVTEYVRSFREEVNVKELSESAFALSQKLQVIREEAQSLYQRPGSPTHKEMTRWYTVLTAINYNARHLIASAYRKKFEYPEELVDVFKNMEEKLDHNIETLIRMLKTAEHDGLMHSLDHEREQIERLAPIRSESQRDLIHHLYYVWRINQSIEELGRELGAETK
ncbi:FUSC family protein [Jeotgalibacillus sp. S-D1]|uniref:FUSC family protein n=1 Tax=Jeotgalibacillus sp. S-D1 TaxID=2552189 RepID=UPI001F0EB00A|nr:FUSC family protein [Jeotgalibacillus sp. S-D1]